MFAKIKAVIAWAEEGLTSWVSSGVKADDPNFEHVFTARANN
jgi:hypothetical protein